MQAGSQVAVSSVTGLASRDRVRAFELAAGLSVLFMIAVHDLWHWGSPDTWTTRSGRSSASWAGRPPRRSSSSSWRRRWRSPRA